MLKVDEFKQIVKNILESEVKFDGHVNLVVNNLSEDKQNILLDWVKACKYTDDSGLTNFINNNFNPTVNDLTNQIDGKIESWFQTSDPASAWTTTALKKKHVGDMWYSSTTKLLKRYSSSYAWVTIEDQKAIDAYEAASKAQDTADGKRRVYVCTPRPPYEIGDLWLTGGKTDGLLKR